MTTHNSSLKCWLCLCLAAFVVGAFPARASAEELKLRATLIWGTNDEQPADSGLKPVDPAIAKKLKDFKWTHYYEISRKDVSVGKAETRVQMSADCVLIIKTLDNGQMEVTLVGKGKTVGTIKKELHKGGCLVTGGNATYSTGWFIVIKRSE
jgi:hypothetical protein